MSFLQYKSRYSPKIELKSKECIDAVLQPLTDHLTLKINDSLTSRVFNTVISMAVNRNSVHSISKKYHEVACETSLRYHLKKLNMDMDELIQLNEKILLQGPIKTRKHAKIMNSPLITPTILIKSWGQSLKTGCGRTSHTYS